MKVRRLGLLLVRPSADRAALLGVPTRTLAYIAVALAGGFLLLVAAIIVLTPSDF